MIVKVLNPFELMERHAWWGNPQSFINPYTVLAIRIRRKKKQYLIEDDYLLTWWDSDLFQVIEPTVSKEWMTVQYKRFHKFRNKKYDFSISTSYYQGPQAFLDDEDFMFDIIENPMQAHRKYCELRDANLI